MKLDKAAAACDLITIIVNYGMGSKILQTARKYGLPGGTICLGQGTINNRLLEFLGLAELKKEIILMVAQKEPARQVLQQLNEKFEFDKPNHGVAFTTSVSEVVGSRKCQDANSEEEEESGVAETMYQVISVVVDRGKAEEVIDAATEAGSTGGTIINARGSGVHETSKLFAMEIEPEKELVLIISKEEKTAAIITAIRKHLQIDEPGHGIIFIQNINQVYGLYE